MIAFLYVVVWTVSFAAAQSEPPRFPTFNLIKPRENFVHTIGRIVLIPEDINRRNFQNGLSFRHNVPDLLRPPFLQSNRRDPEENIRRNQKKNHLPNDEHDNLRNDDNRKESYEVRKPNFHGPQKFETQSNDFNEPSQIITETNQEKLKFKEESYDFRENTKVEPGPFKLNPVPVQFRKPNNDQNEEVDHKFNKKPNNINKESEKPQEIMNGVDHDAADDSKKMTMENDFNDELTLLNNDIIMTEDDFYTTTEDYETTTFTDLFNRMGNVPPALLASLVG